MNQREAIRIKIGEEWVCRRRLCTVCGGETEKTNDPFTFIDPADGQEEFMCERCVAAGPESITTRLLAHADHLEHCARDIRRLAEHVFIVPTPEKTRPSASVV